MIRCLFPTYVARFRTGTCFKKAILFVPKRVTRSVDATDAAAVLKMKLSETQLSLLVPGDPLGEREK